MTALTIWIIGVLFTIPLCLEVSKTEKSKWFIVFIAFMTVFCWPSLWGFVVYNELKE